VTDDSLFRLAVISDLLWKGRGRETPSSSGQFPEDEWETARRDLLEQCAAQQEQRASGSNSEVAPLSECRCEDNSEPIPCDGKEHTRIFGPVAPHWPNEDHFGGTERVAEAVREFKEKARGRGKPGYFEDMKFHDYIQFKKLHGGTGTSSDVRARRRRIPGGSYDLSIKSLLKRTGARYYWPPSELNPEGKNERTRRETLEEFIRDDPRELEELISAWIKSIPCELNDEGLTCEQAPHVIPPPGGEGSAGRKPKLASEGGDQYWSIGAYAETEPTSGGLVTAVGCIEVKMKCFKAGAFVPEFHFPEKDEEERPKEKKGFGEANLPGRDPKNRIVGRPPGGSRGMWSGNLWGELDPPTGPPSGTGRGTPEGMRFWAAASTYDQARQWSELRV